MAHGIRSLPQRFNPLMSTNIPDTAELVSRRRLGRTQLAGSTDSKSSCLDYAHLRAPLPKGIVSGIWKISPGSYFLMRRSSDGFVSATGMFKAAFPYADILEEELERKHVKSLDTTSPEETAGNIWVSPEHALILAGEYHIEPWIVALLDPAEIALSRDRGLSIKSPPRYDLPTPQSQSSSQPRSQSHLQSQQSLLLQTTPPTPTSLPHGSDSRRSASPAKQRTTRSRPISPKNRAAKARPESSDGLSLSVLQPDLAAEVGYREPNTHYDQQELVLSTEVMAILTDLHTNEAPVAHSLLAQSTQVNSTEAEEKPQTATEQLLPRVEQPRSKLKLAKILKTARDMVAAVPVSETKATSAIPAPLFNSTKRKAENISTGDEEIKEMKKEKEDINNQNDDETSQTHHEIHHETHHDQDEQPRAKRVKSEMDVRKEKVRNRALLSIGATIAVGMIVPWTMNFL